MRQRMNMFRHVMATRLISPGTSAESMMLDVGMDIHASLTEARCS